MSEQALTWAKEQRTANVETQIVLWMLALEADENGFGRGDLDKLASHSRQTPEQTLVRVAYLETYGLLEYTAGPGWVSYRLRFDRTLDVLSPAETER